MVQAVLKIAVGLIMAIMGINMLGIFPQLRRLSIHTPVALQRFVGYVGSGLCSGKSFCRSPFYADV